jgi:glyceraldehyde-3-phosphate dehydrogenase (NADP+)
LEINRDILSAKSFINNEWIGHSSINLLKIINKYDQSPLSEIPFADAAEVQFAMANSVAGFKEYSKWSAEARKEIILKIRDGLILEKDKFINLIISEAGKPFDYAKQEIERALKILEIAADETLRFGGEVVPMDFGIGKSRTAATKRHPIGPVLAISPFNFPLVLSLHKIRLFLKSMDLFFLLSFKNEIEHNIFHLSSNNFWNGSESTNIFLHIPIESL